MLPSKEALKIFFWAITNSDISNCQFRIISGKPTAWLSERWMGEFQSQVFDVMFAVPIPRIILLMPAQVYYEYGEIMMGDRFFFIPF